MIKPWIFEFLYAPDSQGEVIAPQAATAVFDAGVTLWQRMDKLGFEVIPVPFWGVAAFGGGLHCATADVNREGTLEDYFPNQIPGY